MALNSLFCADVPLSNYSHSLSHSAGAPPQTPLGELTALPRPSSWISGGLLLREREGRGEDIGEEREGIEGEVKKVVSAPLLRCHIVLPLQYGDGRRFLDADGMT